MKLIAEELNLSNNLGYNEPTDIEYFYVLSTLFNTRHQSDIVVTVTNKMVNYYTEVEPAGDYIVTTGLKAMPLEDFDPDVIRAAAAHIIEQVDYYERIRHTASIRNAKSDLEELVKPWNRIRL